MATTPTSLSSRRQSSGKFSRGEGKEVLWQLEMSLVLFGFGNPFLVQEKGNSADSIHVVCRFRPVKPNETNTRQAFTIDESSKNVDIFLDDHDKKSFSFDKVISLLLMT